MECVNQIFDRYLNNSLKKGYFEYDFIYPYSNENIKAYLTPKVCKEKSNGLAVLGGGDHAFNLITNGVKNVDTFDINRLTEYYVLGLKRAMILKYSYQEYMDIMRMIAFQKGFGMPIEESLFDFDYYSDDIVGYLISDLRSNMDQKYRDFWDGILSRFNNSGITFIADLVFRKSCSIDDYLEFNNYLKDEESYNLLKSRLGKANINFKCSNVTDVVSTFSGKKYDIMLFSNTFDYVSDWDVSEFKEYIDSLGSISNVNAQLFFHYIFDPTYFYIKKGDYYRAPIFAGSGIYYNRISELGLELKDSNDVMVLQKRIGGKRNG